ncbi:hypothetical protein DMUE_5381, partial [Dictyocoela muelleri]
DAGIIRSFKSKFFSYQLSSIVNRITSEVFIENLYKEITIKDAIIYSKYAWDDVKKIRLLIVGKKLLNSKMILKKKIVMKSKVIMKSLYLTKMILLILWIFST